MYRLIIKPRAIEMATKAYKWYEEQREGLGELFLDEIEECYDRLEASPESYQKIKANFRHVVARTFPYVIIFEILGEDIVVYAVFHTSRNPRKKFKK